MVVPPTAWPKSAAIPRKPCAEASLQSGGAFHHRLPTGRLVFQILLVSEFPFCRKRKASGYGRTVDAQTRAGSVMGEVRASTPSPVSVDCTVQMPSCASHGKPGASRASARGSGKLDGEAVYFTPPQSSAPWCRPAHGMTACRNRQDIVPKHVSRSIQHQHTVDTNAADLTSGKAEPSRSVDDSISPRRRVAGNDCQGQHFLITIQNNGRLPSTVLHCPCEFRRAGCHGQGITRNEQKSIQPAKVQITCAGEHQGSGAGRFNEYTHA